MRCRQVLLALPALAAAAALGAADPPALPVQPLSLPGAIQGAMPPPLPSGPVPDLDLIFTAQVAGWIEPCG